MMIVCRLKDPSKIYGCQQILYQSARPCLVYRVWVTGFKRVAGFIWDKENKVDLRPAKLMCIEGLKIVCV